MWVRVLAAVLLTGSFLFASKILDRIPVQVVGQHSTAGGALIAEREFFENLAANTGLPFDITYVPIDELGIKDDHQLAALRGGGFDLVSLRFLQNTRHEPSLFGVDPAGAAVDTATSYAIMQAYGPALDRRLQERFNAKLLGMWPFGPQVLFCRKPVESVADLQDMKIRVGNETAATLFQYFSAKSVVIPFERVQSALETGVVDCAVSSTISAYAGGWPEYTTHMMQIHAQMGINGYVISLDLWNRLSINQQKTLQQAINEYSEPIWDSVEQRHTTFAACNTGQPCPVGPSYNLVNVIPSEQDQQALYQAFNDKVFPHWAAQCDQIHPGCSAEWWEAVKPFLMIEPGGKQ